MVSSHGGFLTNTVRDWNELTEQTRNSPSLSMIYLTKSFTCVVVSGWCDQVGFQTVFEDVKNARLRTACSLLCQHLHSKNIVDNPFCTFGDIEDIHHFLFVCHQYTDLRRDLLNSVSDIYQPNLNVLLCGDITLTFVQNKQIFKAVQEFIIKSKRFEYTH